VSKYHPKDGYQTKYITATLRFPFSSLSSRPGAFEWVTFFLLFSILLFVTKEIYAPPLSMVVLARQFGASSAGAHYLFPPFRSNPAGAFFWHPLKPTFIF
jgi:hypothetical protein